MFNSDKNESTHGQDMLMCLLWDGGMLAAAATAVGGLVVPAAAESPLEAFVDLTTAELLGPAPNVNREPAGGKRVT